MQRAGADLRNEIRAFIGGDDQPDIGVEGDAAYGAGEGGLLTE
jgi:hypothetical protein